MSDPKCCWPCPEDWSQWSKWLAAGLHGRNRWRLPILFVGILFADGRRTVYGDDETFQKDPHWKDNVLFYEYFHGENGRGLGASHQTGWTALVAKLLQQQGDDRRWKRERDAGK